ncbi:Nitric oxide reductase transcription regulator NorR2 [compost metagenome]
MPESLAESELFGHVKGAFSGASSDRAGRFDAANGGTLFLDEVGELPLSVQAKLLRTLQNGEIQRLGADKPLHVDVRIIAATNRHLPDSIRDGLFRADLYHRLSVYPLPIPPLRERGNDVLMIAGQFLELNRTRLGLRGLRLSAAAERALLAYHWPGNVRELEHVISRAALKQLSREGSRNLIITLEPQVLDLDSAPTVTPQPDPQAEPGLPFASLNDAVDACQRQAIVQALRLSGDNWASAARLLAVDPSNLHKLARRLRLK